MSENLWIENAPDGSLIGWVRNTLAFARVAAGRDGRPAVDIIREILEDGDILNAADKVTREQSCLIVAATIAKAHEIVLSSSSAVPQDQFLKYLDAGGTICPFCGSEKIDSDAITASDGPLHANVRCPACKKEWIDTYTLTGIDLPDEELGRG